MVILSRRTPPSEICQSSIISSVANCNARGRRSFGTTIRDGIKNHLTVTPISLMWGVLKERGAKKCKWKICMHCPQCLAPCTDQSGSVQVTKRACLCVEDKTEDFFQDPTFDESGLKYVASMPRLEKTCLRGDTCNNSLDNNIDGYCYRPFSPTPAPPTPTPPTPAPPTPVPPTLSPPTPGPPTAAPPTPLPPLQVQSLWYFQLTAKCRKTCWEDRRRRKVAGIHEWPQKCTWKACGACTKCVDHCDKRCFDSPKSWDKLCSWRMCGTCPMCPEISTPVPPTPTPPTPAPPPTFAPPTPLPPTPYPECPEFNHATPITHTCLCRNDKLDDTLCYEGMYCYPGPLMVRGRDNSLNVVSDDDDSGYQGSTQHQFRVCSDEYLFPTTGHYSCGQHYYSMGDTFDLNDTIKHYQGDTYERKALRFDNPNEEYKRGFVRRRKYRDGLGKGDASLRVRTIPLIRKRAAVRPTAIITASSQNAPTNAAKFAFDGDTNTFWDYCGLSACNSWSQWLQIQFTAPQLMYAYGLITDNVNCPQNWTLKGGNNEYDAEHETKNDTTVPFYVVVDDQRMEKCTVKERIYTIGDPQLYSHYMWHFTDPVPGATTYQIVEVKMYKLGNWLGPSGGSFSAINGPKIKGTMPIRRRYAVGEFSGNDGTYDYRWQKALEQQFGPQRLLGEKKETSKSQNDVENLKAKEDRMQAFAAADTNGDGMISLEEAMASTSRQDSAI